MRNITNVQHHVGIKVQKGGKQEKKKTQKQHVACTVGKLPDMDKTVVQ